jgi:hypothetical protein
MLECRSTYPAVSATDLYIKSLENASVRKQRPPFSTYLKTYAGSEFLPKCSILATELLKFGLQILVGHGLPAFVTIEHGNQTPRVDRIGKREQPFELSDRRR